MKTEDTEVLGRQRAKPNKIKARYSRALKIRRCRTDTALVLSPLRAQQFGILRLTVCVIQLLGLISFDVT